MAQMGASGRLTLARHYTPAEGDSMAGGGRTLACAAGTPRKMRSRSGRFNIVTVSTKTRWTA